ncbi:uncharacterized protein TEOVI_000757500 [Trypanosoma equiperdum]|uniref:Trypanosome variant surface glycoprotein (A-type) n=1 Tax=Trypanosoma equiperdum TaxID=5694 RepID=A0A1G4I981_TRYEQ|nr:hypothetical protein TEOVI_000757500 [Trypanosoma equiperdum]
MLADASGGSPTLYLAGCILKLDGLDTAKTTWSTTHATGETTALAELDSRLAQVTTDLQTQAAQLQKLNVLRTSDDPEILTAEAQSVNLGLPGDSVTVTIKDTVFKTISKELKKFLDGDQTEKNKERQNTARDILIKALEKQPESTKCDIPATEDVCHAIKEEIACNSSAACSFNKTETDENKRFKFDAKKATSNEVPVVQTQTGGTESTAEKCSEKKG